MSNSYMLRIIHVWYLFPILYLMIAKNIYLPMVIILLAIYFFGVNIGFYMGKFTHVKDRLKMPNSRLILLILGSTLILQIRSIIRFTSNGINFAFHRDLVFSDSNYLFGSSILYTLYNSFLFPSCLVIILYQLSKLNTNKRQVFTGFLILFLDAMIKLGRFPIIYIIFFLFFYGHRVNFKKRYKVIVSITFIFLLQIILYFRQYFLDASFASFSNIFNYEIIEKSIIAYQYYGYLILEIFLKEASVYGELITFHTASFIFYLAELFSTKFGVFIDYPWEEINLKLSKGFYIESIDFYTNAFSTNFLPVYLDLGFLGILIFGLYSGLVFGFKTNSNFFTLMKNLMFFISIFGIYQPIILSLFGLIVSPLTFLFFSKIRILKFSTNSLLNP